MKSVTEALQHAARAIGKAAEAFTHLAEASPIASEALPIAAEASPVVAEASQAVAGTFVHHQATVTPRIAARLAHPRRMDCGNATPTLAAVRRLPEVESPKRLLARSGPFCIAPSLMAHVASFRPAITTGGSHVHGT